MEEPFLRCSLSRAEAEHVASRASTTEDKAHYTEKQSDLRWSDTETEEQTA